MLAPVLRVDARLFGVLLRFGGRRPVLMHRDVLAQAEAEVERWVRIPPEERVVALVYPDAVGTLVRAVELDVEVLQAPRVVLIKTRVPGRAAFS